MSKHIACLGANDLYGNPMPIFFPTSGFKWIYLKEFDSNKYSTKSSKGCVLEVDFEYCKELHELHNNYYLAPDKIEMQRKMLSNYQINIVDFYNIPIVTVEQIVA